jgi:alpha-L-rhamnosidase
MKAFITALTVVLAASALTGCAACHVSTAEDMRPVSLRCEYLTNPMGIDVTEPRLSWKLESKTRGQKQTAYHILVASSHDKLNKNIGDLWDTGTVKSDQSNHVAYRGKPMKSRMRCYWQVRVWDKDGKASKWSQPAEWSMGLLGPEDWKARWISTEIGPLPAAKGGKLTIQSAAYATLDGTVSADMTKDVENKAADGLLEMEVHPKNLGRDPAPGIVKELHVRYSYNGQPGEVTARDFEKIHAPKSSTPAPTPNDTVYIRRTFTLNAPVESAAAYVNVRGAYELYINGQKVSDDVLSPAVTGLEKYLLYRTYDIRPYLKSGDNCAGIWLGQGWCQSGGWEHVKPLVRAQLEISAGGKSTVIGTDSRWLCTPSSHSRLGNWKWNNMGGEHIDARRAIDGWSKAGINEESWLPVKEVTQPTGKVASQACAPNRIGETIALKAIRKLAPNTWELDFGKNLTGWMRLHLAKLNSGAKITMRYADKHFDNPADNPPIETKTMARKSLWTVETEKKPIAYQVYGQIDEFISSGKNAEVFCSKFNYHGFRYVIIEGLSEAPTVNDAEALLIETDLNRASSFECSNDLFNRIHNVNIWTIRCLNLGGQMVDCPHRERRGYGDGQTSIAAQIMARDSAAFYSKWTYDWLADQKENGQFPHTSPFYCGSWGGPGWGGLACVLPWEMYLYYGDTRLLEQAYESMKRYVQYLENLCTDNILRQKTLSREQFLGDWVAPGRGMDTGNWPGTAASEIFNNGYRIYLWELLEQSAHALGKADEAEQHAAAIARIRPRIHEEYYNAEKTQYGPDEQAYQVMPLMTGVTPDSLVPSVQQRLEYLILTKNKGHLDTGMLGTHFMMKYLMEAGRNDLIYTMYNQETYPGWGYMLSQGATTFWEEWTGYWSQIHSCFAGPGSWFYQGLAGIRPDPASPGFKNILLKPAIVGSLTWVNSHHDSIYGRIVSDWKLENGLFIWDINIPVNSTATVYLPAKDTKNISESGQPLQTAAGIRFLKMEDGRAVLNVDSGCYSFVSRI